MKFIIIIILFLTNCNILASDGGYAGSSFRYGSNARSIALANAQIANHNVGYNPFSNPALLGFTNKNEYGFSYIPMSLDRYIQSLSIAIPVPPTAAVGISLFMSGTNDIPRTTSTGDYIEDYSAWEGMGIISFGVSANNLSAGINIKILKNEIDDFSATGLAGDIGILYQISSRNRVALLLRNITGKYSWDFKYGGSQYLYDEDFPFIASIGSSSYINKKILFLNQIDYMLDNKNLTYRTGVEIDLYEMKKIPLNIRFGLHNQNEVLNYSVGFGYVAKFKNSLNFGIDYALDTGGFDQGLSHLFSFKFYKL